MSYGTTRDEYLTSTVMSASPAALLIMLYDRAILDVRRAELEADGNADALKISTHLIHAQDIVTELINSLDVSVWDGGRQLQALYLHLYSALLAANVSRNAEEMRECREILEELRATWSEAAKRTADQTPVEAGTLGVG